MNSFREALDDEQVRAHEMVTEVRHPVFGTLREVGCPIKTDGAVRDPAPVPALGEHTRETLRMTLGYSAGRIARLKAAGAIATTEA